MKRIPNVRTHFNIQWLLNGFVLLRIAPYLLEYQYSNSALVSVSFRHKKRHRGDQKGGLDPLGSSVHRRVGGPRRERGQQAGEGCECN